MSEEQTTREVPNSAQVAQAAQQARQVARRRRYRTLTVLPDRTAIAEGLTLGKFEPGPMGPILVVEDRCRPRCEARGSKRVEVDLAELADAGRWAVEEASNPTKT